MDLSKRDELMVAQALLLAAALLGRLPNELRPESNINDMRALLSKLPPYLVSMAAHDAERWDQLID